MTTAPRSSAASTPGIASAARLDRPPPADATIDWPAAFGRRFAVFVDTEEEFDWSRPLRRDATATRSLAALPVAQRRLEAAGVVPTYLVDYPIATAPAAAEMMRPWLEAGRCAIGTQLHPWVNPPHDETVSTANSFVGSLSRTLESAKLTTLTDAIAAAFGRRPDIYRAGRYGVGPNSAALLAEAGYRMDCSVRARFDYSGEGGPDFTECGISPYWAGPAGALLEVPLTTGFVGVARRFGPLLYRAASLRGLLARSRLIERVALTPEGIPLAAASELIRALLGDGTRLLCISFHSPSLEPGHTPYVRDAADLRLFHAWWDGVLGLLGREGGRRRAPTSCSWRPGRRGGTAQLSLHAARPLRYRRMRAWRGL